MGEHLQLTVARFGWQCCAVFLVAQMLPGSAHCAQPSAVYVALDGNDGNDGSSAHTPLRTIAAAMALAGPGTTVLIGPGRYHEQVVTRRGGEAEAPITITAYAGPVTIDGSGLEWASAGEQNRGLVELRHPHVRIVGLEIAHSKDVGIVLDADDLTVENCRLSDMRLHGISTDTARQTAGGGAMIHRIVINGNLVERAALSGSSQAISLIADGFTVRGNTVRNSPREGIDIWLGARNGEVTGNRVYANGAAGIYVDGAAAVRIEGNLVHDNRSGIGISSENPEYATRDIWVFNNVIDHNRDSGVFLWDDRKNPGRRGVQNVTIAYNTIVYSTDAFYFAGEDSSVSLYNNLAFARVADQRNEAARLTLVQRGNVWLRRPDGFVEAGRRDYHLAKDSPAIGRAVAVPVIRDGRGEPVSMSRDAAGSPRRSGEGAASGAFEFAPDGRSGDRAGPDDQARGAAKSR